MVETLEEGGVEEDPIGTRQRGRRINQEKGRTSEDCRYKHVPGTFASVDVQLEGISRQGPRPRKLRSVGERAAGCNFMDVMET